jgi:acetoacetyl-CoA synthetase
MKEPVAEGELLWTPSPERVAASPITAYTTWLARERGVAFASYEELWRWSTSEIEQFWASLWAYFDIDSDRPYDRVLDRRVMPGAHWFAGSRVNFTEHVLRRVSAEHDRPAVYFQSEGGAPETLSWTELGEQVRSLATGLRRLGVTPGDRVVSYLPNVPQAVIAMLATAAIGAVWCSAPSEFGAKTVLERFQQIEPAVVFVGDGYRFGGRTYSRIEEAERIVGGLDSLRHVVWVPLLDAEPCPLPDALPWSSVLAPTAVFEFERVDHDHPLWILFSSGTTGLPKAIVHSHVGALLEMLKLTHLQCGLGADSTTFIYTTTGWVLWNILVGALLTGSSVVLYNGSPVHPSPDALWQLAEDTGTTCFGASSAYLQTIEKSGLRPGREVPLTRLTSLFLSGSPTAPQTYDWALRSIKPDLWINSLSGGTEICSAFVGGVETLPVFAGEMQARMLGMDVHAFREDGSEVLGDVGELVCTQPFPSMPIRFWNDEGDRRYRETYFDMFPGVWRHGDFLKINDRGGCYIYGRSDATLNRHGVRIGTAEVYRAVERIDEVTDSLVVCLDLPGGGQFMPLFVQLRPGAVLDEALRTRIASCLRDDYSPRHVPDQIHQVDQIPYTLTGKKMEIPVRRILMGWPPEKAASVDAMRNPESIDYFRDFANETPHD